MNLLLKFVGYVAPVYVGLCASLGSKRIEQTINDMIDKKEE